MKHCLVLLVVLWGPALWAVTPDWNARPVTFATAKKHIYQIYQAQRWSQSFYCDCAFDPANKTALPKSCGFSDPDYADDPKRPWSKLAEKVEMEHIVPASRFGKAGLSLAESFAKCRGVKDVRRCAERHYAKFKQMHSDPHNLVPVLGTLNRKRGNRRLSMVAGHKGFGECDFELHPNGKHFEPRPQVRGDVARVYFYMAKKYHMPSLIHWREHQLFESWTKEDPVSLEECARALEIERRTGVDHQYIEANCRTIMK